MPNRSHPLSRKLDLRRLLLGGVLAFMLLLGGLPAAQAQPLSAPDAAPDLAVTGLTVTPPVPAAGQAFDVTVTVANLGDTPSPGFLLEFFVAPADRPPTLATPFTAQTLLGVGLSAGESSAWTFPFTATVADPPIYAWVDRANQVAEAREDNNLVAYVPPNVDAFEPDNSCGQPSAIVPGAAPQARILAGLTDQDWVTFSGQAGVVYTVATQANDPGVATQVELHSLCDHVPSLADGPSLRFTAPADGVYRIRVTQSGPPQPDAAYLLQVQADAACRGDLEPNDVCSAPGELVVGGAAQTHTLCTPGDVDWLRLPVEAGVSYVARVENSAAARLSLYPNCAGGVALATGTEVRYTAVAGGALLIKAENNAAATTSAAGAATAYQVSAAVEGPDGCAADASEPDDSLATARPVIVDGPQRRLNICPPRDVDWLKVDATAGVTYTVETVDLGPAADPVLCLHDAQGAPLACDDDAGPGLGARLQVPAQTAGPLYISARDADPGRAGAATRYALRAAAAGCVEDAFEPDNGPTTARPLAVGAAQAHTICPAGDEDWVGLTAAAGQTFVIATTATGPEADTLLEAYDAAGTRLAANDDAGAGPASRLTFTAPAAGDYAIRARVLDPAAQGAGTAYTLTLASGSSSRAAASAPGTPVAPPVLPARQDAPVSAIRTLILVNPTRLEELHGTAATASLMGKLEDLARHTDVLGEIVRLDRHPAVAAAYAAWQAGPTDVAQANQVANAIRRVLLHVLAERPQVAYLVLVGDDRALPFRRLRDTSPLSEATYAQVIPTHPTGAALAAGYYLSDDYYATRVPAAFGQDEALIPQLAAGRLVETPADMIALIDAFRAAPATSVARAFVSGHGYALDAAQTACADWQTALGTPDKAACLTVPPWTKQAFAAQQLNAQPPNLVQAIYGDGDHFTQRLPNGQTLTAGEIAAASVDLRGGLILATAGHAGLNVPPTNSPASLDLAEVFVRKGANFIGSTGYGWGLDTGMGYGEQLVWHYTRALLGGQGLSLGQALVVAKQQYYDQTPALDATGLKTLQQTVFYGLPMFRAGTPGSLAGGEPFPSVQATFDLPGAVASRAIISHATASHATASHATASHAAAEVVTGTVALDFTRSFADPAALARVSTGRGDYFALHGRAAWPDGGPAQPLYFADITVPGYTPRGALLRAATFATVPAFDPVLAQPVNEAAPAAAEWPIALAQTRQPPFPLSLQVRPDAARLLMHVGQFSPETQTLRTFRTVVAEVQYSAAADVLPPTIALAKGVLTPAGQTVNITVATTDPSGIREVSLVYLADAAAHGGAFRSVALAYDAAAQTWTGSFAGSAASRFLVQVVDAAGNVASAPGKGDLYRPFATPAARPPDVDPGPRVYLPALAR